MRLRKVNKGNWRIVSATELLAIQHLRSDGMDDDLLIQLNLDAAAEDVETSLGWPLVSCQLTGYMPEFESVKFESVKFRGGLLVKYYDTNDDEQTLSPDNYTLLNDGVWVYLTFKGQLPALADRLDAVNVIFDSGYANVDEVNPVVKQAVLMRAGFLYAEREDAQSKYLRASDNLIKKIRKVRV